MTVKIKTFTVTFTHSFRLKTVQLHTNPAQKHSRNGMVQTTRSHLQPMIGTKSAAKPAAKTPPTAKNDRHARIAGVRSRAGIYSISSTNLKPIKGTIEVVL